jgi:hypothetical protein
MILFWSDDQPKFLVFLFFLFLRRSSWTYVVDMKVMWDDWTARARNAARDELNGHSFSLLLDRIFTTVGTANKDTLFFFDRKRVDSGDVTEGVRTGLEATEMETCQP